jgi:hypothetical protein
MAAFSNSFAAEIQRYSAWLWVGGGGALVAAAAHALRHKRPAFVMTKAPDRNAARYSLARDA